MGLQHGHTLFMDRGQKESTEWCSFSLVLWLLWTRQALKLSDVYLFAHLLPKISNTQAPWGLNLFNLRIPGTSLNELSYLLWSHPMGHTTGNTYLV